MSKRLAENYTNNSKKQKLDDTFWDDDIDDDCFGEIANKLLEQDEFVASQATQGNHSIISSYDSFRPKSCFASTQIAPAVFKDPPNPGINRSEDIQMKLTYLEQKYESKEGEVAILRDQLQKLRSEMMLQQSNKYKEYLEKTNEKDKEIKTVKGQLEFKNLEIANLKQKISDISKAAFISTNQENLKRPRIENSLKNGVFNNSSIMNSPRKNNKSERVSGKIETNIVMEIDFPLLSKFLPSFFENLPPEVHVLESRTNQYGRSAISHLHNQLIQEEFIVPFGPKITVKISKKEVGLEHIYPDMLKIIKSNSEEINSDDNNNCIRNVLSMSTELLKYFEQYLEQLEIYYRTEYIEQMDRKFLQDNYSQYSCTFIEKTQQDGEIGLRAGRTVQFIAEVLPFNLYLSNFVISSRENSDTKKCYLSSLRDIVRKIFILRKTQVCYHFLDSVAKLLLNISRSHLYENIFPIFSELIGLLLFTRPPTSILHKLLVIFKNCSTSINFLDFLCKKPETKKFMTDKKRKLQYFNEESCKFSLFVTLYNTGLNNVEDREICLDVAVNVISFVYNIFMNNPSWIHEQQKNQCICLEQLYQITLEVSYKSMVRFWGNSFEKERYFSLFEQIVKVLQLLSFNSCNLLEKYSETYSKYREMCSIFMDDQKNTVDELSKLNISEEIPNVSSSRFDLL